MKKLMMLTLALAIGVAMVPSSAFAIDLGINMTSYDGVSNNSSWNTWYHSQEDQEVEPGAVSGQDWDLEGFFYNGTVLNMVGGYDFVNGLAGTTAGDIFLDVAGYDRGHASGYDLVLDLDFIDMAFDVIALDSDTILKYPISPVLSA